MGIISVLIFDTKWYINAHYTNIKFNQINEKKKHLTLKFLSHIY